MRSTAGSRRRAEKTSTSISRDVVVERLDHRLVVVDDAVDDRVEDGDRAVAQQVGPALELRWRTSASGLASPWRTVTTKLGADEELELAELDVVGSST